MKRQFAVGILIVLFCTGVSAKQKIYFSHSLNAGAIIQNAQHAQSPHVFSVQPDTFTVVAARVDFQPQKNTFTTGTGMFDTTYDSLKTYLDAPPHDTDYFNYHLQFLQNYFDSVSKGNVYIKYVLLPNKATVPNPMGHYAPPPGTSDTLAYLVKDGWSAAASANPQFDFNSLDPAKAFFIIFHAGVGRDIDLSSTYGYNPQPQDLPSLYFNLNALESAFGASYKGVPVGSGNFVITNTAIIPETETRLVNDTPFVLGTNALIAASFGNFLGLPALYNTTAGYTGIGSFGLEDIASILSSNNFSGAFPPVPNAWERAYLGWTKPVELRTVTPQKFTLSASQTAAATDTTIARISINTKEYFLLENRERNPADPKAIGIKIYAIVNGKPKTYNFFSDVYGFNAVDISALDSGAIITGCSNYDWAIPGSGILIWHIDENIIDSNAQNNSVNASGHTRGVNLMEADGTMEIGVPIQTVFGTFISQGSVTDPWYNGVHPGDTSYANVFSDFTQPNSRTNAGFPSGILISNFDSIKAKMRFQVQTGMSGISMTHNFPQRLDGNPGTNAIVTADINSSGQDAVFLATPNSLLAWKHDGTKLISSTDSVALFASEPNIYIAPSIDTVSEKIFALSQQQHGAVDSIWLNCWSPRDTANGVATAVFRKLIVSGMPRSLSVPIIENMANGGRIIFAVDTLLYVYDESGNSLWKQSAGSQLPITAIAATDTPGVIVVDQSGQSISEWNTITGKLNWVRTISIGGNTSLSVAEINAGSQIEIVVVSDNGSNIVLNHAGDILSTLTLKSSNGAPIANPSAHGIIIDVKNDGNTEFVADGANLMFGQNVQNSTLTNFPVSFLANTTVASPIACQPDQQVNGIDIPSLIFAPTADGMFHAIAGNTGQDFPGFPIAISTPVAATPAITPNQLFIASADEYVYSYDLSVGNVPPTQGAGGWTQYLHDAQHTSYNGATAQPVAESSEFFPAARAFNWPNPVYDKFTHIHFFVSENATVRVRIVNLANELIEQLPDFQAAGGVESDMELHTDGIQSGVYIVRVEADATGNTGVAFIKMAIVN